MSAPSIPIESLLAHREWVRALAHSLVRDPSAADDLEQEAWLAALRHPPRHDGRLRGWFGALLRSRARDAWRGEGRRTVRESAAPPSRPTPSPVEIVAQAEAHRRVVDAVLSLEEPYRATILQRFFEGLPLQAVSERMGVPVETVRTRVRRGIERLRERLDREDGGNRSAWMAALLPLARGVEPGPLPPPPVPRIGIAGPSFLALAGVATAILVVGGITFSAGKGTPATPPSFSSAEAGGGGTATLPSTSAPPDPRPAEKAAAVPILPAAPVPPGPPRACVSIRVLDLADGGVVPGLVLVASLSDGSTLQATTDGGGCVQIPAEGLRRVLPRDGEWRSPRYAEGEILSTHEMWIYRTLPVEGVVRFESAEGVVNPASVTLTCANANRFGQGSPWGERWLRDHGVETSVPLPGPDVDGSFFARVPRIRGAHVLASLAGWIGDLAPVPLDGKGTDPVRMDLVLREPSRVTGVLRDDLGNPVAGVHVEFYLTMHLAAGKGADILLRLRLQRGYTLREKGDEAFASFVETQETGQDGTFDFPVLAPGTGLLLIAHTARYRSLAVDVGRVEEASIQRDLVLDRLDEMRCVRLMQDGLPVCSTALLLVDLSCGDARPGFRLSTDERGEVPTGSLVAGHRYAILSPTRREPGHPVEVAWKGEPGDFELGGESETK